MTGKKKSGLEGKGVLTVLGTLQALDGAVNLLILTKDYVEARKGLNVMREHLNMIKNPETKGFYLNLIAEYRETIKEHEQASSVLKTEQEQLYDGGAQNG